jgi:type II secretory pathway component PulF
MKIYSAVVVDQEGKKKTLVEESISSQLLEESLYNRGYYVLKILEGKSNNVSLSFSKLSKKFILDFTYNIYTLLEFGIDINEVFRILTGIYGKGMEAEFIGKLNSSLAKGEKLSAILKNYSSDLGDFYISMVSSGEASGKLADSFKLLFQYLKNNQKIREKIFSSSIYPIVLLILGFAALHLMLLFIIPNFGQIYTTMDFKPPLFIAIVLAVSHFMLNNLVLYMISLVSVIAAAIIFFKSKYSRILLDIIFTKFPIVSKINKLQLKIKTSFSLEILLKGGSSLEDSLIQLAEIETIPALKKEYTRSVDILKEGGNVKDAFACIKGFDSRDLNIIEISESISKTKEGFEKLRQDTEYQLENYLETVFKLFEPAIMILIAFIIFFLMYIVISPTLSMLEKL